MIPDDELQAIREQAKRWLKNIGPTAIDPKNCLLETHIPAMLDEIDRLKAANEKLTAELALLKAELAEARQDAKAIMSEVADVHRRIGVAAPPLHVRERLAEIVYATRYYRYAP